MRRFAVAVLLVACGSSSDETPHPAPPLASGVHVGDVSLYQAVKVPLALAGQPVASNVPVVAGRDGLLRVMVEPEPGFEPRTITAHLELRTDAGPLPAMDVLLSVTGPSVEADLASSFDFELPGATITPDLGFDVKLRDAEKHGAPSAGAEFPGSGAALALGAKSSGSALHMVLVPFVYQADGSDRLPDLGDGPIARYRQELLELYPTPAVEIRIHDPIPWATAVSANANGWGEILQELLSRRQQDRANDEATPDEYYYGLFAPASDLASYCAGGLGCVLGLTSTAVDPSEEFLRGSVGIGFGDEQSALTMAHETGHAHGRMHAPCAPPGGFISQVDPSYPHTDAQIGSWGYDIVGKELIDPAGEVRDLMSYCTPAWVSDYTYGGLFERMAFVSTDASSGSASSGGAAAPYLLVSLDGAGRLRRGRVITISPPKLDERLRVELLDTAGGVRRSLGAAYRPYSDLPGGILLLEAPEAGDRSLVFGGRTLVL
jgi:Peptidase M66